MSHTEKPQMMQMAARCLMLDTGCWIRPPSRDHFGGRLSIQHL